MKHKQKKIAIATTLVLLVVLVIAYFPFPKNQVTRPEGYVEGKMYDGGGWYYLDMCQGAITKLQKTGLRDCFCYRPLELNASQPFHLSCIR